MPQEQALRDVDINPDPPPGDDPHWIECAEREFFALARAGRLSREQLGIYLKQWLARCESEAQVELFEQRVSVWIDLQTTFPDRTFGRGGAQPGSSSPESRPDGR